MGIRQFSGRYLQDEDRLLFRLNTDEAREYRFLLTRRTTQAMLAGLGGQAVTLVAQRLPASPAAAVAAFAQDAARRTTRFGQHFEAGQELALGADPVLVLGASFELAGSGAQALAVMRLRLRDRRAATFRLPPASVQSLSLLLERLQQQAGWQLAAPAPGEAAAGPSPPGTDLLH